MSQLKRVLSAPFYFLHGLSGVCLPCLSLLLPVCQCIPLAEFPRITILSYMQLSLEMSVL